MYNGKKTSSARFITLIVVLAVHVGAIFIPLGVMLFMPEKPKQIPFRVKIGGSEPSHAPIIGPPTRVRPTGNEGGGGAPPPPPPIEPPKPAPKPAPKPVPKPAAKPKPKPKPVVKPKPKPVVKTKPVVKPKPKPVVKPKIDKRRQPQITRQKRLQEERRRQQQIEQQKRLQAERRRRLQQQVHHDKRWDNWDPNKPAGGGTNTNIAVPIGPRDQGQALGKVDGRTPAGGATPDEDKYWEKLEKYLYERWQAPAGIFVTAETAVVFELQWDNRGKIVVKKIISTSPNPAVTQSVKMMLEHLDYIPTPPYGMATRSIKFRMVSQ